MTAASASIARRGTAPKTGTVRKSADKTLAARSFVKTKGVPSSTAGLDSLIADLKGGIEPVPANSKVREKATKLIEAMSIIERHELVVGGMSTRLVKEVLRNYSSIPESDLLQAIGVSTRTLDRREDSKLGQLHSGAALALIEVTDMAQRVLGTRKLAEQWLKEPSLALDGKLPLDLIASAPGIEAVKDLLTRMEYGVYA